MKHGKKTFVKHDKAGKKQYRLLEVEIYGCVWKCGISCSFIGNMMRIHWNWEYPIFRQTHIVKNTYVKHHNMLTVYWTYMAWLSPWNTAVKDNSRYHHLWVICQIGNHTPKSHGNITLGTYLRGKRKLSDTYYMYILTTSVLHDTPTYIKLFIAFKPNDMFWIVLERLTSDFKQHIWIQDPSGRINRKIGGLDWNINHSVYLP